MEMKMQNGKWKKENGKRKMRNENANKRITMKMENAKKENT